MIKRSLMKKLCVSLLDTVASEHRVGHQDSKAARYILTNDNGVTLEIMFEKNAKSPANLWCLQKAAGPKLVTELKSKESPASQLWTKTNDKGDLLYGRHSSLENMDQLNNADLVCFAIESIEQIGKVLDQLLAVTPVEMR